MLNACFFQIGRIVTYLDVLRLCFNRVLRFELQHFELQEFDPVKNFQLVNFHNFVSNECGEAFCTNAGACRGLAMTGTTALLYSHYQIQVFRNMGIQAFEIHKK